MKKLLLLLVALVIALVLVGGPLKAEEIEATVSPNILNIASASTVVTVHTNIAYSLVVGATVELNGVEISWWKSDNQGCFVAKFTASEVKGIVEPGTTATLTLSGETTLGDTFSGTDYVDVIEVKKAK